MAVPGIGPDRYQCPDCYRYLHHASLAPIPVHRHVDGGIHAPEFERPGTVKRELRVTQHPGAGQAAPASALAGCHPSPHRISSRAGAEPVTRAWAARAVLAAAVLALLCAFTATAHAAH